MPKCLNPTADSSLIEPRSPPKQVRQEKIRQTFSDLTMIPVPCQPTHIKHLYLSHNLLTNLEGIQCFPNLESLNVSYNHLRDITQLVSIPNKLTLKRIGLKMNYFAYGYQDYAVNLFPNLQRVDDIELSSDRVKYHQTAMFLSKNLIPFMNRANKVQGILSAGMKLENGNVNMIQGLSEVFTLPDNLRLKSIGQILSICYNTLSCVLEVGQQMKRDYVDTVQEQFRRVLNLILLHFSARNDENLLANLQGYGSLPEAFAHLGVFNQPSQPTSTGGFKFDLNSNPAQYLHKIPLQEIHNHPMNIYANHKQSQTLNGVNKWTPILTASPPKPQLPFYENIPILIYQKNYLEVIAQIVMAEVSCILHLYHNTQVNRNYIRIDEQQPEKFNQKQKSLPPQESDAISLNYSDSLASFGVKPQNMLPENYQKQKIDLSERKTLPKIKPNQLQIANYSLYEISLVFKVFRSLKKRVLRKRR